MTICAIAPAITLAAAERFAEFKRDVLVLWGTDDVFFPVSLGRRLASAFSKSTFKEIANAKLFVGIDQPDTIATAIAEFVDRSVSTPLAFT